ncbi:MAG TPA: NAD(P)/FAD-dependent oxidoreductase [Methanomicrobiales archaeon]|nr:NAD(P)/FAD-dependent oxidoreductase [Methanomicrobiales archaeon]
MRICILGGGLTGLSAALRLSSSFEVTLLERDMEPGGCLSSYRLDGGWVERFYHHCFAGDVHLLALLGEIGLSDRLEWLRGTTGSFAGGKVFPLNTPLEILKYPYLGTFDKARLALFTLGARRLKAEDLDGVTAKDFVTRRLGEGIYREFFRPLLRSKFGDREGEVSAGWLVSRVAIRSNRGLSGERLGYLRGGFHLLVERLAELARKRGCTVEMGTPVTRIERHLGGWSVNGKPYDRVLSTIPPQEVTRLGGPDLPAIPYQGAACMTLGLDRDVTGGVYWLNMNDPAPYGAVVSHTNFIPPERYGGERILYLASYFQGTMDPALPGRMVEHFCGRFGVPPEAIRWHRMAVEPFAGPVYTTGYRGLMPAYEEKGLFLAGMFSRPNYPERSMEGSIVAGTEVAGKIGGAVAHG